MHADKNVPSALLKPRVCGISTQSFGFKDISATLLPFPPAQHGLLFTIQSMKQMKQGRENNHQGSTIDTGGGYNEEPAARLHAHGGSQALKRWTDILN